MTTALSRADVERVAVLARLKLTPAEIDRLQQQMQSLLEYVEVLNEIDTEGVEPMAHAVEVVNVLREDAIQDSLPRADALSNAPRTDAKYFLVPAILEGA